MSEEKKKYDQEEVDKLLEDQRNRLKKESKEWIEKKAEEIGDIKGEKKAIVLSEEYRQLTVEEKLFKQDKQQLEFYIKEEALPKDMTLGKMMMNRQLGRELGLSLIQTINGICYINGKPAVYGETYLSLITKNGYKINVIKESDDEVEIELVGPNGSQKGSYSKKQAQDAGLRKGVYLKYGARMLRYKAIRNAQNILCPHIMGGAYLVDEAKEIETEPENQDATTEEVTDALKGFSKGKEGEKKEIS